MWELFYAFWSYKTTGECRAGSDRFTAALPHWLRATRPAVYFHSWYFMNSWIFSSFFFFPHTSNAYLFPLSACPSCWPIQMLQLGGCLGLRLIFSKRILKGHFPSLCLQRLIFQPDWSHNCLNKDGHYLPSVFATGNEANCPQGRKWLPICRDIDDDFEKGWKRGKLFFAERQPMASILLRV